MTQNSFFVDFPNFYSSLIRSRLVEPEIARQYVLEWLDFDRLTTSLTGSVCPVWLFYSGQRLGPSNYRSTNTDLQSCWAHSR